MNEPTNSLSLHQISTSALAAEFCLTVPALLTQLMDGGLDLGTSATLTKEQEAIARKILTHEETPEQSTVERLTHSKPRQNPDKIETKDGENSTEKHLTAEQLAANWETKPETIEHWATIAKRAFGILGDALSGPFSPDEIALLEDVRANVIGGTQGAEGMTPAEYVQTRQAYLSTVEDQIEELEQDRLAAEERQALDAVGQYVGGTAQQFFDDLDELHDRATDEVANAAANRLEASVSQRIIWIKTAHILKDRQEARIAQKPKPLRFLEKVTLMVKATVQPPAITAAEAVKLLTGTPPLQQP